MLLELRSLCNRLATDADEDQYEGEHGMSPRQALARFIIETAYVAYLNGDHTRGQGGLGWMPTHVTEMPDDVPFPARTLFLIVVTDRLGQAFDDVSGIERQGIVIIDMKERRDEDEPAPQPAEAKSARVMVIACSPVLWAKTFELRTSDRKRHALKAVRLESPRSPASKPSSIE